MAINSIESCMNWFQDWSVLYKTFELIEDKLSSSIDHGPLHLPQFVKHFGCFTKKGWAKLWGYLMLSAQELTCSCKMLPDTVASVLIIIIIKNCSCIKTKYVHVHYNWQLCN